MSTRTRMTLAAAGTVAAGLVATAHFSFQKEIEASRTRLGTGSKIIDTAFGPIEYAERGAGNSILMIHGAGGGFDQGLAMGEAFFDGGNRVIAPSRFGYLRTPLPANASPAAQADAHTALLDSLGVERVVVVGVSAGSPSAVQLCLRHPDRCSGLVLVVPMLFAPRQDHATNDPSLLFRLVMNTALKSDFLFWTATRIARTTLVKSILATPPAAFQRAPEEEQGRVLQMLQMILPITERAQGLQNDAAVSASLSRYELELLRVPTILITAEDDLYGTLENARYTADHIPGARLIAYRTGGHMLVGHNTEIRSRLKSFLSEIDSQQ